MGDLNASLGTSLLSFNHYRIGLPLDVKWLNNACLYRLWDPYLKYLELEVLGFFFFGILKYFDIRNEICCGWDSSLNMKYICVSYTGEPPYPQRICSWISCGTENNS